MGDTTAFSPWSMFFTVHFIYFSWVFLTGKWEHPVSSLACFIQCKLKWFVLEWKKSNYRIIAWTKISAAPCLGWEWWKEFKVTICQEVTWLPQPVNTCGGAEVEKEVGGSGGEALPGKGGILWLPARGGGQHKRSTIRCPWVCLAAMGSIRDPRNH